MNYYNLEIYISSETHIKVWCLKSGILKKEFQYILPNYINVIESETTFNQYIYAGDCQGHIYIIDIK